MFAKKISFDWQFSQKNRKRNSFFILYTNESLSIYILLFPYVHDDA